MQNCNEPSGFFANSTGDPQGEEEGPMAPTFNSSLCIILLIIIPEGYGSIALFVLVFCLVPVELGVNLPASNLVVPILVAAQEIHCGTYIVSHIVGHNAPWLLQ